MTTASLNALCDEYRRTKSDLTERERVEREDELWKTHRDEAPHESISRADWLKNNFGGSVVEYQYRHTIMKTAKRLQHDDKLALNVALDIALDHFRAMATGASSNGKGRLPLPDTAPALAAPPVATEADPPPAASEEKGLDKAMLVQKVNELSNKYRSEFAELTHKARYEIEVEIWSMQRTIVPCGTVKHHKETRREYQLQTLLGRPVSDFERHRHIGSLGDAADELWERVDRDMTLNASQALIYRAKLISARDGVSLKSAVHGVLVEYDQITARKRRRDGKVVKVRNTAKKARSKASAATASKERDRGEEALEFRGQVRALTENFVNEKLRDLDVDEYVRNRIVKEFDQWIEAGVTDLFNDVRRHSNNARRENLTTKIGRSGFREACLILGIQGEFNKKIDLVLAKKHWAERSHQLHPDKYGEDKYTDELRKEFQAVQDAYQLLKDYMRQLKR